MERELYKFVMKTTSAEKEGQGHHTLSYTVKETLKIVIKIAGILMWLVVLGMTVLEVKHYYNLDFLPGIDTPVEHLYSFIFE